jgi:hypothetical protein
MGCDSRASFLACTFASPCLGCKPKARVMTMINCPKFIEMQKMFDGKFVIVVKVQPITKTQIVTTDVNVVDVNVTTKSKVTE